MTCPHCASSATTDRPDRTELGYRRFRCRACKRVFNGRTGTLLNRLQYPTDMVSLVVLWRFRYKLSLRDLSGSVCPVDGNIGGSVTQVQATRVIDPPSWREG